MTDWTDEKRVTEMLSKRQPLPKPMACWPKAGELYNFPELMRERVRLTRAVGINLTTPIDEREFVAANDLLDADPTLTVYLFAMPYHAPAPAVADVFDHRCDESLAYYRRQFEQAAILLSKPPAYMLLDCERFRAFDPISHAMTRFRLDAVYTSVKTYWPNCHVHWFGQGARGWQNRIDGWGPVSTTIPTDALGDSWGTGLYYRDRMLVDAIIDNMACDSDGTPIIPWLSFTHQKALRIRDDAKELEYVAGGPPELELCWEWGHELAKGAGLFGSRWATPATPLVAVYPSAFDGAYLRANWWEGFNAMLCGAEHVQIQEG